MILFDGMYIFAVFCQITSIVLLVISTKPLPEVDSLNFIDVLNGSDDKTDEVMSIELSEDILPGLSV